MARPRHPAPPPGDALLAELTPAGTPGDGTPVGGERRTLVDWCEKVAKSGPWRSVRSTKGWCRVHVLRAGESRLRVAVPVELFG